MEAPEEVWVVFTPSGVITAYEGKPGAEARAKDCHKGEVLRYVLARERREPIAWVLSRKPRDAGRGYGSHAYLCEDGQYGPLAVALRFRRKEDAETRARGVAEVRVVPIVRRA